MLILGIETSCDETGASIIKGGSKSDNVILLSNVVSTSLPLHSETGGIIPENAAREQIKYIIPVIKEAFEKAKVKPKDIDVIAVTYGPGLIGSLLVGVETAKALSYVWNKPIIPTNHLLGHVYANFIDSGQNKIEFPALALIVSGGHTDLILLKNHQDFEWIGGTRDDAAGECFDKCARLLGYPYPGGPKISQLAEKGNPKAFSFPRPMTGSRDFEFSFSGLKTSFLNSTKEHFPILRTNLESKVGWEQISTKQLSGRKKEVLYDLCASLQQAIVDVLVKKTIKAAKKYQVKSILLGGGVAANSKLREELIRNTKYKLPNTEVFVPQKFLCTDNGAMIASAAFYNDTVKDWASVDANPNLYFNKVIK